MTVRVMSFRPVTATREPSRDIAIPSCRPTYPVPCRTVLSGVPVGTSQQSKTSAVVLHATPFDWTARRPVETDRGECRSRSSRPEGISHTWTSPFASLVTRLPSGATAASARGRQQRAAGLHRVMFLPGLQREPLGVGTVDSGEGLRGVLPGTGPGLLDPDPARLPDRDGGGRQGQDQGGRQARDLTAQPSGRAGPRARRRIGRLDARPQEPPFPIT